MEKDSVCCHLCPVYWIWKSIFLTRRKCNYVYELFLVTAGRKNNTALPNCRMCHVVKFLCPFSRTVALFARHLFATYAVTLSQPERGGRVVELPLGIREVLISNLSPETSYYDWCFSWLYPVSPSKWFGDIIHYARTVSFHFPCSLFSIHHNIRSK